MALENKDLFEFIPNQVREAKNSEKTLVGIPTRGRPEYLSILLSSLIFQTDQLFDVLIVDTDTDDFQRVLSRNYLCAPASRFIDTLKGLGHSVTIMQVPVSGRSEVTAVNYILDYAVQSGYKYLYKTDDDHLLQPDLLYRLINAYESSLKKPCLVSAMTPFMKQVKEGFSGPFTPPKSEPDPDAMLTSLDKSEAGVSIGIGHFDWFESDFGIVESSVASNANFLMEPDAIFLWEDINGCSLHADVDWMIKLKKFLGYRFFFDTGCVSWHVTAPSGGVRERDDDYEKDSFSEYIRKKHLVYLFDKCLK